MQTADQIYRAIFDLYWIAFLITGCAKRAAEVALNELDKSKILSPSKLPKARRAVIAGALKATHDELALSTVRVKHRLSVEPALPSRKWFLDPNTNKSQVQEALLAIDVFPRCALLLTVFEHFEVDDAALLLNADPELVIRARMAGLFELTRNLASLQGWSEERASTRDIEREKQYA